MAFTQTYMGQQELDEQRKARELNDKFKSLQQFQDLIRIKLGILCRNGKTQALMDDIERAAAEYGAAFTDIINSAAVSQKVIPRR